MSKSIYRTRCGLLIGFAIFFALLGGTFPCHGQLAPELTDFELLDIMELSDPPTGKAYAAYRALQDRLDSGKSRLQEKDVHLPDAVSKARAAWLRETGNKYGDTYSLYLLKPTCQPENFGYFRDNRTTMLLLDGRSITDDHIRWVDGETKLGMIEIFDTKITGKTFSSMQLPGLKILRFSKCPVTDASLTGFDDLPLISLEASQCGITNRALEKMPTGLIYLRINETKINAAGISAHLNRFASLNFLQVSEDQIDKNSVNAIGSHKALKELLVICSNPARQRQIFALFNQYRHLTVNCEP